MKEKQYYLYIATNKRHTTVYIGVTNNLFKREDQHKNKIDKNSFTAKYNIDTVVYYEAYNDIKVAITIEKQIKAGSRKKKIELIEKMNPE
ncbi:GIY-YIG nuclease family protein [Candidatus Parcubacteria bacterium]|nr:GIY-YIG nuclease family protein [Candidatus Parcubacteria bacterium]